MLRGPESNNCGERETAVPSVNFSASESTTRAMSASSSAMNKLPPWNADPPSVAIENGVAPTQPREVTVPD